MPTGPLPLLAGFAAGVILLQFQPALPGQTAAALVGATGVALAGTLVAAGRAPPRTPPAFVLALALAAALVGFGYAASRAQARLADSLPPEWEGEDIALVGVVDDLPDETARGTRFAVAVERVDTPGARVPERLSLVWPASWQGGAPVDDVPEIAAGERWRLTVRLKRPHGYANPAGFDLEAWLLERNLRATGYVRADPANVRIDAMAGRLRDHVQAVRGRVRERIATALAGSPYAGVIAALTIGDQRAVPDAQWTVFNRTGVGHLVSISGLHVTALASLAGAIAAALARRSVTLTDRLPSRKAGALVAVVVAGAYTLVAGAEIPAVRTFTMVAVGALGLAISRRPAGGIVWLWALVAVLVVDPWASLAPGFWLSYGAVAVLIGADAGRVAAAASGLRERLRRMYRDAARAQWAVTVGLVPFSIALFGQVSLVSPLANAIAIPIVTLAVVPLAVAGILVPGGICFVAAHAFLEPLMALLTAMSDWPGAAWAQHAPATWTLGAAAIGIAWLLAPRAVPGRAVGLVWLLPLALVRPAPPDEGRFRLTVLDAGQGLAAVVRTHRHALVYDAGPRWHESADAGSRIVAPYLRAQGVGRLDALVVSHQDLDHSGGAASVLAAVPVVRLVSSLPEDHPLVGTAGPAARVRCVAGQRWRWDGVDFEILHPVATDYADPRTRTNDLSCVLAVSAGTTRALLTGDIEARSESRLVREAAEALAAEVLVVPHHGSRTSSTPAFVDAVAPTFALFTPGYRNRFGHPRPEIVARYAAAGARVMRTDRDGALEVEVAAGGVGAPIRERERAARYWRDPPEASAPPLD
ncbi:MAG: DNA internalization-related competence protein ComEC/Rec2 [Burkholderiales bacterium]